MESIFTITAKNTESAVMLHPFRLLLLMLLPPLSLSLWLLLLPFRLWKLQLLLLVQRALRSRDATSGRSLASMQQVDKISRKNDNDDVDNDEDDEDDDDDDDDDDDGWIGAVVGAAHDPTVGLSFLRKRAS